VLCIRINVQRGGLIAFAFRQIEQLGGFRNAFGRTVELLDRDSQARALAPKLLGTVLVRPDGRILQLTRDFLEALLFLIVLKETPEERRCALRDL
jgi:hypothetical protein